LVTTSLLAWSGAVLHWFLPPGRGHPGDFLGLSRHAWRHLHFSVATIFFLLVLVHLGLHWAWVRAHLLPWPGTARPSKSATPGAGNQSPGRAARIHAAIHDYLGGRSVSCAGCQQKGCANGLDCTGEGARTGTWLDEQDRLLQNAATETSGLRDGETAAVGCFCRSLGVDHVGIAFCVEQSERARALSEALSLQFRVTSVCCKVGAVAGLDGVRCNPVAQARVLAQAGTGVNVALGLCMGQDALFFRHAVGPVLTLARREGK
jgi:uncharacterized metal-binding protein